MSVSTWGSWPPLGAAGRDRPASVFVREIVWVWVWAWVWAFCLALPHILRVSVSVRVSGCVWVSECECECEWEWVCCGPGPPALQGGPNLISQNVLIQGFEKVNSPTKLSAWCLLLPIKQRVGGYVWGVDFLNPFEKCVLWDEIRPGFGPFLGWQRQISYRNAHDVLVQVNLLHRTIFIEQFSPDKRLRWPWVSVWCGLCYKWLYGSADNT
jgi:hypothetical protein